MASGSNPTVNPTVKKIYSSSAALAQRFEGILPRHTWVMAKKRAPSREHQNLKTAATTTTHTSISVAAPLAPAVPMHVWGEGNLNAELLFIGEAPSSTAAGVDSTSNSPTVRPFAGPTGQLLEKMIEAMGSTRKDVYLVQIEKPAKRENVLAWLRAKILSYPPRVIVTMGETATQVLLENLPLTQLRGKIGLFEGIKVIPTFHPEYLLKTPAAKKESWEDLKIAIRELNWKPRSSSRQ
jgi:uracil-DNA glycosylase family 4